MEMKIQVQHWTGVVMHEAPSLDDTIIDDCDIEKLLECVVEIIISKRPDCWIIDFYRKDNIGLYIKYPEEISEKEFMRYVDPLLKKFKDKLN